MYKLSIIDNDNLPFLKYIASGEKKAEGRVASEFVKNLKIGEKLLLFSKTKFVVCNIKYLHFYDSFENCFLQVHYFFFLYNVSDQIR